jgi:SAM-dependent methyltransferase
MHFPVTPQAQSKDKGDMARPKKVASPVIPSASINLAQKRVLGILGREMAKRDSPTVLVVGCGRQAATLRSYLGPVVGMRLILTDINPDTDAEWLCDAHRLPFADDTIDAVITTAVLEHVAHPAEAVSEIHRVLKVDGLLYSEIPFMQQVHEGAYDFTRYTLTGHRMLLNGFVEREAGIVAGPGTTLLWAIEYFAMAFFRARSARLGARLIARLLFFWVKYFDYFLARRAFALDGASCTYFYGVRAEETTDAASILAAYGKTARGNL